MATPLRACVIGSTGRGNYGHGVDTVWREVSGVELVGVADDDKAGLAAAVKRLDVERGFADYREMLDTLKPDLVGIGPRWLDRHSEMVVAAAERGVHIYMEKPFCRSPAEADAMIRACESAHVKLAIAHQTRYSPLVEVVRQLIAEGKIGRVLELRGRGKEDRRGGPEDLWVLGSHIMNLIATLGGAPQSCFAVVEQNGKPATKADIVEGNEGIGPLAGDSVRATYALEGGPVAYFASTRGMAGKVSRFALQILGSTGILEITSGYHPIVSYLDDPSWSPARGGSAWQKVTSQGIGKPEVLTDAGLHGGNVAAVKDLIAAIREDRRPLCGMYEGRTTIEMISGVFESHRVGGPVPLPLSTRVSPLTLWK